MKFIALTECPQGQQPGEIFEATADAGNVLVMVGSAKIYEDHAEASEQEAPRRRTYRRTDLRAED